MYGFSVRGTKGNLILDDSTPILTQMYKGQLVINREVVNFSGVVRPYAWCEVVYPTPVTSGPPPLVFAVPAGGNTSLGMFSHRGGPGAWTGFAVLVCRDLFMLETSPYRSGTYAGWEYRVCGFGQPGSYGLDEWGLRILKEGRILFDSAWPIVKFDGLMTAWNFQGFRHYDAGEYWTTRRVYGSSDWALATGTHTWGPPDGEKGFLLSSLGSIKTLVDVGDDDVAITCCVLMGFAGTDRSKIWAVSPFGSAQHPAGNLDMMRQWNVLTATFKGI